MRPAFYGLLFLFVLYAGAFIYRTSFEIAGVRFYCLFDDAMISMRYAKNLAAGWGLVWNPGGERVEGFTNPLWVLLMAFVHVLPIASAKISLFVQVTGGICLFFTLLIVRKISLLMFPGSTIAEYVPAFLTAMYIPLLNWSLQGMEVGPLTLLAAGAVWIALHGLKTGHVAPALYWILGASTLVRMDFALFAAVLLGCLALADPANRRRHLMVGGSVLLLFLGVQTAARYAYYGELLPNTYFLKVNGITLAERLHRGGLVFLGFVSGMTWVVFVFPLALLLPFAARETALLAILFLAQCAYSIYVGGDAWEWWGGSNRYIAVGMPFFFILFGGSLARVHSVARSWSVRFPGIVRSLAAAGTLLVLLVSLIELNNVKGAAKVADWFEGGRFLASAAIGRQPFASLSDAGTIFQWLLMPDPLDHAENVRNTQAAFFLDSITCQGARVAVVRAGALPYFSGREFIDLLGKSDKVVARSKSRATIDPLGRFYHTPGHSKWSYAYSIGQCKPDVIVELWVAPEEAHRFLEADYQTLKYGKAICYLRRGSTKVRWEVLAGLAG